MLDALPIISRLTAFKAPQPTIGMANRRVSPEFLEPTREREGARRNMIHPRIRSPIIVNLGHVDAGKTTLLDTIRDSAVAEKEPGLITQHICPYYIPSAALRGKIGALLETLKIDLTIPGLLWIDSPGHEAFTTLRKRGGAIADIAVLIVDIFE